MNWQSGSRTTPARRRALYHVCDDFKRPKMLKQNVRVRTKSGPSKSLADAGKKMLEEQEAGARAYSHSMVLGGLELMS